MRPERICLIGLNKRHGGPHTKKPKRDKICMFNTKLLSYPFVNNWYLGSDRLYLVLQLKITGVFTVFLITYSQTGTLARENLAG